MMSLLAGYCVLIVAASFCGGWLPFAVELTHRRLQMMISMVGGLMLGIGMFHLLPHAVAVMGPASLNRAVACMMFGLLAMFFLIRAFHFHQHDVHIVHAMPDTGQPDSCVTHEHDHDHDHDHDHAVPNHVHVHHSHKPVHALSWFGVAIGLALHTLIDGVALGASIQADQGHPVLWSLYGFGTFAAIFLHKPLDAISITSIMAASGWSAGWRHAVNGGFALMCPLGAVLFVLGVSRFADQQATLIGGALAFSAGVFVCISLGDLLPELEFHSHDRLKLSAMVLLGVAAAYAIGYLEPPHVHNMPATSAVQINVDR
jgi:zinc and cadmium transporter